MTKSFDVSLPLAINSSYILNPISLLGSTLKLGPFNATQLSTVNPLIVTVSKIGLDCNLAIQTCWFGCIDVGNGSYNLTIKEPSLPVQVVITLFSASPKFKVCVKYLDVSVFNICESNCFRNPSTNLLTATGLGISNNPFKNFIVISSSLPINVSLPLILNGTNFKVISIWLSVWVNATPSNPMRDWTFNVVLPVAGAWMYEFPFNL